MKLRLLSMSAMLLLIVACKKGSDTSTDNQWATGVNPLTTDISQWLVSNAPPVKTFTIAANNGGYISSDSIGIYFSAGDFVRSNGAAYNSTVNIKLQTVTTIGNMLFSGITTIAGTRLLASGGMFRVEAYDADNNSLRLRTPRSISAAFMATPFDTAFKIFTGSTTAQNSNRIDWDRNDSATTGPLGQQGGGNGTFSYGSDLFQWTNLDQFMNGSPLTDITVTVPANFDYSNTTCFFKYAGRASCAYIPGNWGLKAFSTQGSYYKVIVGNGAKIICVAKKDSRFYYQVVSISSIALNRSIAISSMAEVSETALKTVIAGF